MNLHNNRFRFHSQCGQKVGVAEEVISECFDGGLGTQLQLEAEILTKAISPSFVPTIVYNWVMWCCGWMSCS